MILIRADANELIGTGHVMRCLSVAAIFSSVGEEVKFVTANHKSDALINQMGFEVVCLERDYAQLDREIGALLTLIKQEQPRLLLIDSYFVSNAYFRVLSPHVKIAYFDDLNAARWDVEYLINYNIFANILDYSWYTESRTKLFLGPQYAPLRNEFANCSDHEIKDITDILVSAGGADPEHITEKIISGICPEMNEVRFHFIVGALNPRLDDIKALAEGKDNILLHINEKRMSDLMKACDIAVSAAGSTLYELCAAGTPTITYTLADNQLIAAKQFDRQGIMLNAGDCRGDDGFIDRIKMSIEKMIGDKELRKRLSGKMQHLVDGGGAKRIAESLR